MNTRKQRADAYTGCVFQHPGTEDDLKAREVVKRQTGYEKAVYAVNHECIASGNRQKLIEEVTEQMVISHCYHDEASRAGVALILVVALFAPHVEASGAGRAASIKDENLSKETSASSQVVELMCTGKQGLMILDTPTQAEQWGESDFKSQGGYSLNIPSTGDTASVRMILPQWPRAFGFGVHDSDADKRTTYEVTKYLVKGHYNSGDALKLYKITVISEATFNRITGEFSTSTASARDDDGKIFKASRSQGTCEKAGAPKF